MPRLRCTRGHGDTHSVGARPACKWRKEPGDWPPFRRRRRHRERRVAGVRPRLRPAGVRAPDRRPRAPTCDRTAPRCRVRTARRRTAAAAALGDKLRAQCGAALRRGRQLEHRLFVVRHVAADELRQAAGVQQARGHSLREGLADHRDWRYAGPQRLAGSGVRVARPGVEKNVGRGQPRQVLRRPAGAARTPAAPDRCSAPPRRG